MKVAIGCDHAGFDLKDPLKHALTAWGYEVEDYGSHTPDPVDFPDIAEAVCGAVQHGRAERGVLVCGTGIGACMAANKLAGIRAALCHDVHSAHQSVEHDDANVLCLGAKIVGEWLAIDLLKTFLEAEFSDEEHFRRRVHKLSELERRMGA
jgi:ribose 5-phosphate isomerase B